MARAIDKDKLITSMAWHDQQGMISSIDDVLDIIEAFPTFTSPNEWINVESNPPALDVNVIVCVLDLWTNEQFIAISKRTVIEDKEVWLGYSDSSHVVTHWMPRPALPQLKFQ